MGGYANENTLPLLGILLYIKRDYIYISYIGIY